MTHGIIFHYFHSKEISRTQGSISGETFKNVIEEYSRSYNILDAEEYLNRATSRRLNENDTCITFDDGLYSQYAVGSKILREIGLTAFYFVYTSPMEGKLEKMEVYRTFRNRYKNIDDFYEDFFDVLICSGNEIGVDYQEIMESDKAEHYFVQYDYYTKNDRIFRYFRNEILGTKYDYIMNEMMHRHSFNPEKECDNIWIDADKLVSLRDEGNVIGLHSHSHFTSLSGLTYDNKKQEYERNKQCLEKIFNGGGEKCFIPM